jgi:hypothetical protein
MSLDEIDIDGTKVVLPQLSKMIKNQRSMIMKIKKESMGALKCCK